MSNAIGLASGPSASPKAVRVEPFRGAILRGEFGANWHYRLTGDAGGFGMGAEIAWQAVATVGHRFPLFRSDMAVVPASALSQDCRASGFPCDMTAHAPLLGLSLRSDAGLRREPGVA